MWIAPKVRLLGAVHYSADGIVSCHRKFEGWEVEVRLRTLFWQLKFIQKAESGVTHMQYDQIQINTQSSIRIEGSKTVYFDPFQIRDEANDADIICITHSHFDHFDPDSIEKVRKKETEFLAPAGMAKELGRLADTDKLHLLSPGESLEIGGASITAQPAYNKIKPFHPRRNGWVGYLLEMDGTRYYIAGDTDALKELQDIKCDVAMVPIGGTYTMTAKEAAGLINRMQPKAVIPIHYGSVVGKPKDADVFRKLVDPGIPVIIKLDF